MNTYASSSDPKTSFSNAGDCLEGPTDYGYTESTAELFRANPNTDGDTSHNTPGRVVRLDRNRVLVASNSGLLHLPYPGHGLIPATGDWVWLGHNRAGEPSVVEVLPRHSALSRKRAFEASSEEQIWAAASTSWR